MHISVLALACVTVAATAAPLAAPPPPQDNFGSVSQLRGADVREIARLAEVVK